MTIFLQGEYFDPSYDRIAAVDATYLCGSDALTPLPTDGYPVKGATCLGGELLLVVPWWCCWWCLGEDQKWED